MGLRSIPLGVILISLALGVQAAAIEKTSDIQRAAQTFLEGYYRERAATNPQRQDEEIHVSVNKPDPRLRLTACDKPLTPSFKHQPAGNGRTTVKVSCQGSQPWSLYLVATVTIRAPVAVASHTLERGSILAPDDIRLGLRDTTGLGRGYVRDLQRLVNMQLKRPLAPGEVIRLSNVVAQKAIARGDQVIIEAKAGSISVVTPGIALADGRVGQQISIRNSKSKRIIKARVSGPGKVEVIL